MIHETLNIQNLKCGGCAHHIKTQLSEFIDLAKISVDDSEGTINIEYNKPSTRDHIIYKLKEMGYPLTEKDNTLEDKISSYVSCGLGRIEKLMSKK